MKSRILVSLILAGFGSVALAQSTPPSPGLPPPAMNDPGVKATPEHASPVQSSVPAPPPKPSQAPSIAPTIPPRGEMPDVQVHQEGDNQVQEYRRSGQLYMVVVTPKGGVPQTYMYDAQGRVSDEHGQKPVRPVMYKVMEWGKSKPAEAASSSDGS